MVVRTISWFPFIHLGTEKYCECAFQEHNAMTSEGLKGPKFERVGHIRVLGIGLELACK